jgi:Zn-dependent peptidase ImmA (M78 family)
MVHLLESKGVRVFSLSIESREVDAFSMWHGDVPFIFLNTQKSAERSRFDAAHELGHLVLHRHASPSGRDAEREADRFASAFLMPRRSIVAQAPRFPTIAKLVELKRYWKVSLVSLVYRLHELGLMNDWNHRTLIAEIGRRGFRTNEPMPIERESSQVIGKVLATLRAEGFSKEIMAENISISEAELDQMIFGLVVTSIRGGATSTRDSLGGESSRSTLRIVK